MTHQYFKSSQEASNYIVAFTYCELQNIEDYKNSGRCVPDGYPEIYVFEGQPLKIDSRKNETVLNNSFACGIVKTSAKYIPTGSFRYWSIKLQPWSADIIFGNKSKDTFGKYMDIRCLDRRKMLNELNNVWLKRNDKDAIKFLEKTICKYLPQLTQSQLLLKESICLTNALNGCFIVNESFDKFQVSRQYLDRIYKQYLGISPKSYATLIKVRKFSNHITKYPDESLAQTAVQFGFSDQSHLIRTFRQVTGYSPKKFFKNRNFILDSTIS